MSTRPNLLWIFCDQLRAQALDCNGDPNLKGLTPNIDRLASQGANLTAATSQYAVCMPFRGGLVTGQYAHVNGVRVHGDLLPTDRRTIAHSFREAGYRTSWIGKWHLASVQGVNGWQDGADYWVHPYLRGGFEDFTGFDVSNHFYRTRYCTGDKIWPPLELKGYQTDALTDLSLEYLSETAAKLKQPWFHCLSVEAPHPGTGLEPGKDHPAPPQYEAMFDPAALTLRPNVRPDLEARVRKKLAGYYAQIANLDHNIGRLLKWLDDNGQADNTLVVFFSDHGEMAGSQGKFEKIVAYDESIRIPMIFRLPGVIDAGRRVADPFSGVDIFPTCASLCGVPIPSQVQGIDASAAVRGVGGAARSEALVQWLGPARYGFGDFAYRAIRTRTHTLCVGSTPEQCFLFDNEADPYQQRDLYQAEAQLRRQLHERLRVTVLQSGESVPPFIDTPAR